MVLLLVRNDTIIRLQIATQYMSETTSNYIDLVLQNMSEMNIDCIDYVQ